MTTFRVILFSISISASSFFSQAFCSQDLFSQDLFSQDLRAQSHGEPQQATSGDVLRPDQWRKVDASLERGIVWLATQQRADGSFASIDYAQPAVTSFCLLAFMAQGENLTDSKYKQQLSKAVDFIAAQQKPNGMIATIAPNTSPIPRVVDFHAVGRPSVYNHAISALALTEAYGQCTPEQSKQLKPVIERAIAATLEMQRWKNKKLSEVGGWRYLNPRASGDSDLSLTGWQLMFLRSAKNAGFDVPSESIDSAVEFVERCFLKRKDRQVFGYLVDDNSRCTRAMAGAGILALAHAGKHGSKEAITSGEMILKNNFNEYNGGQLFKNSTEPDRYHYGVVLCTQAMYHLGGKYWSQFFPPLVKTLLDNQQKDGGWPAEKIDPGNGRCYSTSLCILALSVPNQMLPIFQR